MAAQHRSSPEGRLAFSQLCEKYWYPLYAYVRRLEADVDQARDLTQGFFEKALEKNYLADPDPNRGRFRTFLLASLTHFIANDRNKSKAAKRGGDRVHLSLDFDGGERRYLREPADELTPEKQYERCWAVTLLKQALDQLEAAYAAEQIASASTGVPLPSPTAARAPSVSTASSSSGTHVGSPSESRLRSPDRCR